MFQREFDDDTDDDGSSVVINDGAALRSPLLATLACRHDVYEDSFLIIHLGTELKNCSRMTTA